MAYIAGMTKAMRGFGAASALAGGGKMGVLGKAGLAGTALATGYFGAKALGADRLGKWIGGTAYDLTHRDTVIQVDGQTIARATARPTEAQMRRRRRQRAAQRRSVR